MDGSTIVSTITVTLNAREHLRRTMESVLNQELGAREYIIVDGGSHDGTCELIASQRPRFTARGIAIKTISEPDEGIYSAMNKGLAAATGYFVNFLNAGDSYANPGVLKTVAGYVGEDFVCGGTQTVDCFGNVLGYAVPIGRLDADALRRPSGVCHQAWFQRRDTAPMYDCSYRLAADLDWIIGCARASVSGKTTDALFVKYLFGGRSQRRHWRTLIEKTRITYRHFGWSVAVAHALRIPGSFLRTRVFGMAKRRLIAGGLCSPR